MAVHLMTEPSGVRLPTGKHTVEDKPRERATSGDMITSSGSMPSRSVSSLRKFWRRSLCSHQSRLASSVSPVTVFTLVSSRPARRRCSITSGTPPARNTCTVAKWRGPLGSASTRRGTRRLTSVQSATVGRSSTGHVGDGGNVQQQVGGSAECAVHHHGVVERGGRKNIFSADAHARTCA